MIGQAPRPDADKLALCTAVYPAALRFLRDWYASVASQTDGDYRLWIAVDGVTEAQVIDACGAAPPNPVWVHAGPGDSPGSVRDRLLRAVVRQHDTAVLVDSDDVLHPDRVARARANLQQADLIGCALRLVDERGARLGAQVQLPDDHTPDTVLPRHNLYGLSNTAWRTDVLAKCLPIPPDTVIVDWFLATRAWLLGARLEFDPSVAMDYRRHGDNTQAVIPPFTGAQVEHDTKLALDHLNLIMDTPLGGADADRRELVASVKCDVMIFAERVLHDPDLLEQYVRALNGLDIPPMWWTCVAHPSLTGLWS